MPFAPAPGVAQFSFRGSWNSVIDLVTNFHVQRLEVPSDPWNNLELAQTAVRVRNAFALLMAQCPNDAVYTAVTGRDLAVEEGAVVEVAISLAGASSAAPTGAFVGPIVQWKTGFAGRTNGRTFLPGCAEGNIDDNGQVDSTFRAATKTAADAFLAFMRAANDGTHPGPPLDPVVLSAVPPPGETERARRPILNTAVPAYVGMQRRRQMGR